MSASNSSRSLRSKVNTSNLEVQPNTSTDHSQTTDPNNWVTYFDEKFSTNELNLTKRITDLELSFNKTVDFAVATANEALSTANDMKQIVNELKAEIERLKTSLLKMEKVQNNFEDSLLKSEMYSRKRNLIFTCFDTQQLECNIVVKRIFNVLNLHDIVYEHAHFLHDKKQIIVRFNSLSVRERVWNARRFLSGSRFFVCEDFPGKIKQQHDELFIVAKKARSFVHYQKVHLQANKLTIDGSTYTGDQISSLPDDINPCYLAQRTSDDVVCFGGRLSRFNPLSNFYESPFVFNQTKYTSSEQALQHSKALKFRDFNQARNILNASDCGEQKSLGKHVKNFNQTTWNSDRINLLTNVIEAKFSQNEDAKKYLLDSKSRTIGEASMRDSVYGVGFPIHHKDVLNKDAWTGSNELGSILMKVRDTLKK